MMKKTNPGTSAGIHLFNKAASPGLRTKERYFFNLIEHSTQAFLIAVPNGLILETNRAAAALFGYTEAEFKQTILQKLIDHSDEDFLFALVQLETELHITTDATGIRKNGERFPVEISAGLFHTEQGEKRISLMLHDTSERKFSEAAIRLNNERYDLVVKATNDLIWDWDLVSGEIFRNSIGVEKVYGHPNNECIKTVDSWTDFLHPADRKRISEKLEYLKRSKGTSYFSFEYRFRRANGTYAYILDRGYMLRDEQGKVVRMIGAAQNITERKQAEAAIEASEQRYKIFVQQSSEGIWRIELKQPAPVDMPAAELISHCYDNSWIAECNDAFAKMYGFENAHDVIGLSLSVIMPDTSANMGFLHQFFTGGFSVVNQVSYEQDKQGNELVFENNMLGIVEDGYLCRVWGTQRNITDKIRLENSLREEREARQQQISEAFITGQEKERSQLGEELHDNINQILATSKLYLETALTENGRPDMVREGKLLLEKAMAEIRNLSQSLVPPSLGETGLVQALGDLVESMAELSGLNIDLVYDPFDEALITGNRKLTIFRIVQEQLNNIIKHAHAANVLVSLEVKDTVTLIVKDDGTGFNTTAKRKGVGLRNIISRAEVNNGIAQVDSQPGKGCQLTVRFLAGK